MDVRRLAVATLTGALLLSALTVQRARAAAPEAATLVAPASGSTAASTDVALSVRANDPDGGAVQVRFEGRKEGATVAGESAGDPFTIVALPDTQNYTYSNRQSTIVQQAQWAVDSRNQLNTAMVVQLGDLVSTYSNLTQWGYVSAGLKVMDDAGLPNTVVAGNHDFNVTTGAHVEYDQFFPPTRYAEASWTPSTARYGGYLGQNLFGADPVDTQNMNNFALFSAGGRDFLVLNLEWDTPSYATEWAAKVLDAYPDRLAILVTHSFLGLNGLRRSSPERPGGISSTQLWNEFVSQQCQIRLVLNGHFHDGDLGEANRADPNRCGNQVHQIVSDYQDRANGGDGWLRYYTFDPSADTMTARTYSTKLGTFETDANSQFTLPFDLGQAQPAPFEEIGTVSVQSGSVASRTWGGLQADTAYEWRAVTSDGETQTTSQTWVVRTPAEATLIDDTFSRTVSNGWGQAEPGKSWQGNSSQSSYSVDGSAGRIVAPAGSTRAMRLSSPTGTEFSLQADLALSSIASGSGTYVSLHGRIVNAASYRAKVRFIAGGAVNLSLIRFVTSEVTIASINVSGLSVTPGQYLRVTFELEGTSPTTLRAKLWSRDRPEPSAWTVTASDSTSALQVGGTLGVDVYPSSGATTPSTVIFDRYTVTRLGASPTPPNTPPTAVIGTPVVNERKVAVDGSGSHDSDGSIVSYAWSFGDGSSGTAPSASHTYAADGTYTVRLTVTDDAGDTDTASHQVVVRAEPEPGADLAADTFDRNAANGWGAAQTGGNWAHLGALSRYAVSGGVGNQQLSAGSSAESTLPALSAQDVDLRATLSWSRSSSQGALYGSLVVRRQSDGSDYRAKIYVAASGAMQLHLIRRVGATETTLQVVTLRGSVYAANSRYRVALRAVTSAGATALSAKLWPAAASEPSAWTAITADSTPRLQGGGSLGVNAYASSNSTATVTLSVDDLVAVQP